MCAAFACSRTPDRARSRTEYRLGGAKVGRAVGRRVRDRADELERGREAYAHASLAPGVRVPRAGARAGSARRRRISSFSRSSPSCSVATTTASRGSSGRISAISSDGETLPAVRCAAWIGLNLASRGEIGPASGWLGRAQRLVEPEGECAERGYLLLPAMFQHEASGRLRRRGRGRRGGRAHRRALRRSRSLRARDPRTGSHADQGRPGARGPRAPRRGHGRGHRRGALADRDGNRLLRRHSRLPGGLRGAAGAGVDARARGLVGAPAGDGRLHRALSRAPRRDPAARRLVAGRAGRGAARRRALRRDRESRGRARLLPPGRAPPAAGRLRRAPRRRTARRARSGGSRSRASRSCGWRRDAPTRRSRRSRARSRPRPTRLERARLLPAFVEIMLAAGEVEPARRCLRRARGDRVGIRERDARTRWSRTRAARSTSQTGEPREALVALRRAGETWHALDAPYEIARTRVLVGDACRSARRRGVGGLEHDAARRIFERLGAAPDLARLDGARAGEPRALAAASSRCCGSLPPARRIARSRRRSSSASTPSRGTSRTSSRSSASPPAPRRRRSRSSTTSSDAVTWSGMTTCVASRGWWIRAMAGRRCRPTVERNDEEAEMATEVLRHRDRRRRAGRARDRIPPCEARPVVRDPRRQRARRRPLAEPLGLAAAVLAGELRRAPRDARSRPSARSYPTTHEMADYLESYAARFELPVRSATAVEALTKEGDRYVVSAGDAAVRGRQRRRRDGRDAGAVRSELRARARSGDHAAPLERLPQPVPAAGRGRCSSSARATRERTSRTRRPQSTARSSRAPTPGRFPARVDTRRGRMGFRLLFFAGSHILTMDTPMGRKMRPHIRHGGAPLLRYRRKDLLAAGVERTLARTVGVRDGLPVLDDGRVVDVRNVVWCTGFRPDFSWIDVPFAERTTATPCSTAASSTPRRASTSSGCCSCTRSRRCSSAGRAGTPSGSPGTSRRSPRAGASARRPPRSASRSRREPLATRPRRGTSVLPVELGARLERDGHADPPDRRGAPGAGHADSGRHREEDEAPRRPGAAGCVAGRRRC